jgi:hypothetical protein
MHTEQQVRADAPWQFGPERKIVLPNRRAELQKERQLRDFISANRFGRVSGFPRLLTPAELAKVSREQGLNFKPLEIEYAAARELIAVAQPLKSHY